MVKQKVCGTDIAYIRTMVTLRSIPTIIRFNCNECVVIIALYFYKFHGYKKFKHDSTL